MWFQLQIDHCLSNEAENLTELLEQWDALSVMLEDQQDDPVLEPLPGTTPLWPAVKIQALYAEKETAEYAQQQLSQLFPHLSTQIEQLADKDWERECMADLKPKEFGKGLWICPSWQSPPDPKAVTLMLDPGLSFGTGNHPTTALCLTWLSTAPLLDKSLIDYGCGSGILALAAMKLGAKPVYAVDIDDQALQATRNNAQSNHLHSQDLWVGKAEALQVPVDYLLANILLSPLLALKERFYSLMKPKAQLVVSGILETQADILEEAYRDRFTLVQKQIQAEWCLLAFSAY